MEGKRFSLEITAVSQVIDREINRHGRRSRVVLELGQAALHDVNRVFFIHNFFKVCDAARVVQWSVVWQTDVKKAGVFLRHELVHVILRWSDEKQVISAKRNLSTPFGRDSFLRLEDLVVLIVNEVVVLKLLLHLVVGAIVKISEDQAEEDRHVGVVVQRHSCSFFDEKQDETVVL